MKILDNLSATIAVDIKGILAMTNYSLQYTNTTSENIEAIYHFSLPRMASVLACHVEIDEKLFTAVIKKTNEASRDYEDAIEQKKRCVLVESLNDGLYAINVGNLEADKSCVITLKLAQILEAKGDNGQLTYRLPTTIAPRYGNSQNLIDPDYNVLANYAFDASITSDTSLDIIASSHPINKIDDCYQFSGHLDRDLFLTLDANQVGNLFSGELNGKAYTLGYPKALNCDQAAHHVEGKEFTILMDRSGSMCGANIDMCKQATKLLLNELPDTDRVNIVSFGSTHESVFKSPKALDSSIRKQLRQSIDLMRADMGGTELISAVLDTLNRTKRQDETSHILLITDGSVYISQESFAAVGLLCQQKNVVLHTVGVGYNVSEYVVCSLSDASGGIGTVVNPNDELLYAIKSTAIAIQHSKTANFSIKGDVPTWLSYPKRHYTQLPQCIYANSSQVTFDEGSDIVVENSIVLTGEWAKAVCQLCGLQHMLDLSQAQSRELAETLELLSKHTSFVMVDNTDYRVDSELLSTLVVPQSLPIESIRVSSAAYTPSNSCLQEPDIESYLDEEVTPDQELNYSDIPAFLRRVADGSPEQEHKLLKDLDKLIWRPNKWTAEYLLKLNFSAYTVERLTLIANRFSLPFHIATLLYLDGVVKQYNFKVSARVEKRLAEHAKNVSPQLRLEMELMVAEVAV